MKHCEIRRFKLRARCEVTWFIEDHTERKSNKSSAINFIPQTQLLRDHRLTISERKKVAKLQISLHYIPNPQCPSSFTNLSLPLTSVNIPISFLRMQHSSSRARAPINSRIQRLHGRATTLTPTPTTISGHIPTPPSSAIMTIPRGRLHKRRLSRTRCTMC